MRKKILKILKIIIIIILIFALLIFIIYNFWPSLGGTPNEKDKEDYKKIAKNYKDGVFTNYKDFSIITNNPLPNNFLSTKGNTPKENIPTVKPNLLKNPTSEDLTFTWLGHSTLLLQMSGLNILFDPIFSEYASPVQGFGPKRFTSLPIEIEDLPKIDIVIITHDHYDHLDYKSIKKLKTKVNLFIVPLGVEKHLVKWGIPEEKIKRMSWWEEYKINDLTVSCTPAQHDSSRGKGLNKTLWASYVLKNELYNVYESGDTGYNTHFKEIYDKYGSFDLAFIESGQYNNMWPDIHMKPEDGVQAGIDLNAKVLMPIHWGAFSLSVHGWDDSVERFTIHSEENNLETITPKIGETVDYKNYNNYKEKWWQNIK